MVEQAIEGIYVVQDDRFVYVNAQLAALTGYTVDELLALPSVGVLLAPGAYTLAVIGTNSPAIASYGGNIAVTAIPEPQTYALLLGGLIGIGFVAWRRRS